MKAEITYGEILIAESVLTKDLHQEVSPRLGIRVVRNVNHMTPALEAYHSSRKEVFLMFAEEGENGELAVPLERMKDYEKEMGILLRESTEIDYEPLFMSALDKEGVKLLPSSLAAIAFMLEEDE